VKGVVGEIREGELRMYPDGLPLTKQLRRQSLWLKGGLWLIAFGFLLQAVGTLCDR
jgi:hypothetical protein